MNDNELLACGIYPDLIRLSCGLEDAEDLISDIKNALDNI
jgi:O-acetylhomoserine (thiol)-lyase